MSDISLEAAVRSRRSVRGFLPTQVPEETLEKIFELARWSPSGTNVQPWQVYVASGEVCETLRQEFMRRSRDNVPIKTDHPGDQKLADVFRERKRACARALYGAMDIEWEDREGRAKAAFRNSEFFDAPHVAFLCMNERFGVQSASDVGMYAQTLMLAMTAYGVASCAQGSLRNYPDLVRETFQVEDEVKVLFGISFGFEDTGVPANNARTERAAIAETVQFLG